VRQDPLQGERLALPLSSPMGSARTQRRRRYPAEDLESAAPSPVHSETGDSRSRFELKTAAFDHSPQHCNHLIRLGIAKMQVIFRMYIDLMRPIPREWARTYEEHYKRGK